MGLLAQIDAELQKDLIGFIKTQEEKPDHTLGDYMLADILRHIINGDARLSGCATNHATKRMYLEISFFEDDPPTIKTGENAKWEEWWPGDCSLIMTGEEMLWKCSNCDAKHTQKSKYCPTCGAKMNE